MRKLKRSNRPAPSRAVAGLAFAVALLGTVGCNTIAAPAANPAPPIDAVAGQQFTGVVDTFTDSDPTASAYAGEVFWGDGNVSAGYATPRDTGTGMVYDVGGSNTYAVAGDYNATVNFVDDQINTATDTVPVHVSDTPELDSLALFGTALMGMSGSVLARRRWTAFRRVGRGKRNPTS